MRKNKLIEMLNKLEGNPDIKLWNGYVQDWVDIENEIQKVRLVKMTKEYYIESCRLEKCRDKNDWNYQLTDKQQEYLNECYSNVQSWELNPYVDAEDIKNKRYKQTQVYIMQAKSKGVKTFDRAGSISY